MFVWTNKILVTIKARLGFFFSTCVQPRNDVHFSGAHLAVGFLLVTGLLSAEAAGGVMDAAGASCSYMMEGDSQPR